MIMSPDTVKSLMTLDKTGLCYALESTGYQTDEDELLGCEFAGINEQGKFVYFIVFENAEGGRDFGEVYVGLRDGQVVAEY